MPRSGGSIYSGGTVGSGGTVVTDGTIQSGGFISTINNSTGFSFNAGSITTPKDFKGFVALLIGLIQLVIPLIGVISLWIFFWGLARFIRNSGDEKAIAEGKDLMLWGVIALFVMVSVYGILNILYGSIFGGGITQLPLLP